MWWCVGCSRCWPGSPLRTPTHVSGEGKARACAVWASSFNPISVFVFVFFKSGWDKKKNKKKIQPLTILRKWLTSLESRRFICFGHTIKEGSPQCQRYGEGIEPHVRKYASGLRVVLTAFFSHFSFSQKKCNSQNCDWKKKKPRGNINNFWEKKQKLKKSSSHAHPLN